MSRLVLFLAGILVPLNGLISQSMPDDPDRIERELFERDFKQPGHAGPAMGIRPMHLRADRLKSAMADIGNPPAWNWVRAFTGSGGAEITDMVVDASKNIYVIGTFADSMRIASTTLASKGLRDVFIAKIGSFGTLTWIRQMEASPDQNLYGGQIALTTTGVVVSGRLESQSISGGGKSATRKGTEGIFMAHISSSNAVDWLKIYDGQEPGKIMTDAGNNIFLLSSMSLQKFDATGTPVWSTLTDGRMFDFTKSVNDIWITGAVTDTGMAVGDTVYRSDWLYGAFFLARLDAGGKVKSIEFMKSYIFEDYLNYQYLNLLIEMDNTGDLYLACRAQDEVHFRDSVIHIYPPEGFLMKVDPNMNVQWLRYREMTYNSYFTDLVKVSDNQFFVYGEFYDSLVLGNFKVKPDYRYGYFLAELNSAGQVLNIYDYEVPLTAFEIQSGNTIYSASLDLYDLWLHKGLLSGAESWNLQVLNNGGDAAIWYTMDIDEDGNLYAQGSYRGSVRILGSVTSGSGVFFMKFRNNGTVEWFKFMENPNGNPSGIKVDNEGNVYAWGSFYDYIRIEGEEYHNSDVGGMDMYLVKLDRDGDLKFVKQFDGTGTIIGLGGIELSPQNDILICGIFTDTLVLGAYTLTSSDAYDMFVTKISPNGNVIWARHYGDPQYPDYARSIVSDSLGNIYFTGGFRRSVTFDTITLTKTRGNYEFILVKLDPNGNVIWAKMGGPDNYYTRGHAITIHDDRLYVQGLAYSSAFSYPTITFGDKVLISEFDRNGFLACYTLDGEPVWVKLAKINLYNWPMYKIDTDPAGNVYAGGTFQDTLVVESNLIAGYGGYDYYVMKYSPQGELRWMKTSEASNSGEIELFSLAVFEEDVVLVGGRISNGSVTIGGQVISTASQSSFAGLIGKDIIGCTMELTVQTVDEDFGKGDGTAELTISGGTPPYTIAWSNGKVGTSSVDSLFAGTYQVTVVDGKGCEQYLQFSINIKNGPVIKLDGLGHVSCYEKADGFINISVSGGTEPYSYYWDNGYSTQDLASLSAAPYTVTVTDAGGLITSATYTIEQPKPLDVSFTLKPATCGGGTDGAIEVFTSGGTKPYDWEWNTGVFTQSLMNEKAGKYTLTVKDANNCELKAVMALSEKNSPLVETEYVEPANCGMSDGAAKVRVLNPSGIITYLWSDAGGTTSDLITGQSARGYFVTATSEAGCKAVHLVDIPEKKPVDNQICLVTVDTVIGSNLVVWEKVADAVLYNVYRETSAKDVYLLAGSVAGADLSVFVDTVANPQIRSYRYKIAAVDECGNESYLSHLHKTVHLTISPGLSDNIINLRWDDYIGENFDKFEVWRFTSLYSWELLAELPSTLKSYTDFSAPPGLIFYNVRVPFPNPCVPTGNLRKAGTGPYTHALSNLDDNKLKNTGEISSRVAEGFYLYPNPTSGKVIVWSEAFPIIDAEIQLTDLAGRLFIQRKYEQNLSGRLELDLGGLPAGAYMFQLMTNGQVYHQKLVKQ
jgi:hypothetical protein